MSIVEDHQFAIGEALDISLNPARTSIGGSINSCACILGIGTAGTAMSANLLS